MAKPRIFVSSTYYDLRYVRETLKKFINIYDFEPILNEYGNISYKHGEALDDSCFEEVKNSDMLILIIGGRYGSAISSDIKEEKDFYEKYTSITSQEFRTAHENNIPVYIFIESNVNSEYYTYLCNQENETITYAHVDSINVLKFIKEINQQYSNNIIFTFERIEDITSILKTQWSGLVYSLLKERKEKNENIKIQSSIEKLNLLSNNINSMVTALGKNILNENNEFKTITNKQIDNSLEYISAKIGREIKFEGEKFDDKASIQIANIVYEDYLNTEFIHRYKNKKHTNDYGTEDRKAVTSYNNEKVIQISNKIKETLHLDVTLTVVMASAIILFNVEILPLLKENEEENKKIFIEKLAKNLYEIQEIN